MSKRELSHDEAFAALDAVVFDAIDPAEREAVMAHAAGCDECRAELKRLRATTAQLAFAAPIAVGGGSRDRIRARLMARASAEVPQRQAPRAAPVLVADMPEEAPPPPFSIMDIGSWRRAERFAIAAAALLVATLAALGYAMYDRYNLREALTTEVGYNEQTVARGDSLKKVIATRDSMIGGLIGRDVSVMRLTSAGAHAPFALMFWDKARNVWTFSAHNMPPLRAGRTYQLWLVTASAKISAGTFAPNTDGDAVVQATYRLPPDALRALAVTEENVGGAIQPTGQPIIAVSATQ
ncbi:MAG TPA: anti-sigma factor [Gemmatimonadaceae bacterium]|jgi:hypothetical protein|nr:anti-sigma factor [Gemmatimonadaceae bacterium]